MHVADPLKTPDLQPMRLAALEALPQVSVLMPNYNYGHFIGEALDSLLAQTYPNWEVVVCDDGSKDNSRDVILDYAQRDARIRYVFQENGGVAKALNASFAEARGDIVSILDADDVFLPAKLQLVVDAFRSRPNAGMCIHYLQDFDGQRRSGGFVPVEIADGWIAPQAIKNGGYDPRNPTASGLSFRASVLRKAFPLPIEIGRGLDYYLIGFCIMLTEVVAIHEILTLYRVHGSNISGSAREGAAFLDRLIADQAKVLSVRCRNLRTLLGSWPEMRPEENQALRNCALNYYLMEGAMPPSLPEPLGRILSQEPDWKLRAVWKAVLMLPLPVRRKLQANLRQANSMRKRIFGSSVGAV